MKRILITGASGFIGSRATSLFSSLGYAVRAHVRDAAVARHISASLPGVEVIVGDLSRQTMDEAFDGVSAVLHTAGLAHAKHVDRRELFRVNVDWTEELAKRSEGVHASFLFLSSSKVYGETGHFSEQSALNPGDLYAEAKARAEEAIGSVANCFVFRPPPVYGSGSKGSFRLLLRAVQRGWPLPFGRVESLRSYVFIDNLLLAIEHVWKNRLPGTWNVSDGADISLANLVRAMGDACGKKARLIPVPPALLRAAFWPAPGFYDKIAGQFTLDTGKIQSAGFFPSRSLSSGLADSMDLKILSARTPGKI